MLDQVTSFNCISASIISYPVMIIQHDVYMIYTAYVYSKLTKTGKMWKCIQDKILRNETQRETGLKQYNDASETWVLTARDERRYNFLRWVS